MSLLSQYTDEDSDEDEMERPSDGTMAGSVPNGQVIVAFFLVSNFLLLFTLLYEQIS